LDAVSAPVTVPMRRAFFRSRQERSGGGPREGDHVVPRMTVLDMETAKGWAGRLLKKVAAARGGTIPNMFMVMGNSPWTLEGYLAMSGNLGQGTLEPKIGKVVTLATAELNGCGYCTAANTAMAVKSGVLSEGQAFAARKLEGDDERSNAALAFTREVWEARGKVSDETLKRLRDAEFTDEQIIEILATIMTATLTNYISNVAKQDLEFPPVPPVS
jgi:AhpD family alkylhydroperoxidase